ncbi:amino acid adenylation domain-containing protein [Chryseobacterium sp. B21-037]|uniref:non-ribosomal peptide synthetase n=1 Tax=unclassified Chryseobacterium TaxID=2593645 RepID=UPI00235A417E|nr:MULTISPECIES: non-ribosomal peptide synthetase [unclassified Chryseobacterium]MDC8103587.1 amino acid adenylation domain-containing protein [Chryseobacterium sp. B21-037]MDQ1803192.1 amino acid adenylation domain-containing protein [Chryseobacterium sp. CKR4-1]
MTKQHQFNSIYNGKEFFLTDHKVLGTKVLPGVTYLEMARAAGEYVAGKDVTQLRDISWLQPVKISDAPVQLYMNVVEQGDGLTYEIFSGEADTQLHTKGILGTADQQSPEIRDINHLRDLFKDSGSHKEGADYYKIMNSIGLEYGKTFQGIQEIFYNGKAALSRIALSAAEGFVWTPGMMDSALQTCMGISLADQNQQLMLPFSVREMNIYQALPEEIWCYVTKNRSGKLANSYDIELLNNFGELVIRFSEFVVVPMEKNAKTNDSVNVIPELHLYNYNWKAEALDEVNAGLSKTETGDAPLVLLAGGSAVLAEKLSERLECEVKTINEGTPESVFIQVLEEIQNKKSAQLQIHFVYPVADELEYGFISAMLKTAVQENQILQGKTIGVEGLSINELDELTEILQEEQRNHEPEVRYQSGQREVRSLTGISDKNPGLKTEIKENGVYLITGGAGGLGLIFADYLNTIPGTQLILTGRSELNPTQQEKIKGFRNAQYERCNVTDLKSVTDLIKKIKNNYGHLDGVIHSAGTTRDSLITKKTTSEIHDVFSAKITGAQHIDQATKDEQLDFMMFCSSLAGVFGNTGQADYAAANAWLDYFANHRQKECNQGKRTGKTLSINWPLWKGGGMQIDADQEKYMASHFGLWSMPTSDGISAFETLLNNISSQGVVVYGEEDKLNSWMNGSSASKTSQKKTGGNDKALYAASMIYLGDVMTKELRMKNHKLEPDTSFEQYGIDSIMITKLTNRLESIFYNIPRTLFFECQTLAEVTEFFVDAYPEKLIELTGVKTVLPEETTVISKSINEGVKSDIRSAFHVVEKSTSRNSSVVNEPIAIIGLSGKYPQAKNLSEFWDNLKSGKDSITEIPANRWDLTDFYDEEKGKAGKSYSKWGGFIDEIDHFDPLFFNISVREAELMDPQARLFLQTAWETFEDAGYPKKKLEGRRDKDATQPQVGVYVGVMYEEYPLFGAEENAKGNFVNPGGSISSIANRVSYFFNLNGPSMAVDTMCSSSLTAIHLACESIQNGNCTMALAGGVNISVHPNKYLMLSQGMFVSSKGRCESFGEGGEGYVPGEGVGAVLLKSYSQALADGDRIYGLIKGTALNHGGKTNGYTVPNPKAQASVIKAAMKKAGVKAEDFSYIEAHGTGTSLGDPIEIAGLNKAFESKNKQFCSIGSVKSNIGHCESAAGISGLTKVLLQMQHRQLVPSLHSTILNPNIKFENTPFKVQQELEEWPVVNNKPRLAGISGFGAGGSNAHLIVEEYVSENVAYRQQMPLVIVLSAKDEERLKVIVENLKKHIENHSEINLDDLAYTLQTGREAMEERLAFIAEGREDVLSQLSCYLEKNTQNLYIGNIHNDQLGISLEGKSGMAYLESIIREKESHSLAQLWVKGVNIDWNLIYNDAKPSVISLPSYPFANERYWFPKGDGELVLKAGSKLHPLLHTNTSNLREQQFTSIFTGKELFLTDHLVHDVKTLPGVAYLELAREAGEQSLQAKITKLKEVSWLHPIQINDKEQTVFTSVFTSENEIEFEVYTQDDAEEVHCRGILSTDELFIPEQKNIKTIKAGLAHTISGSDCYTLFQKSGLGYGKSFRGIREMYYDEDEVLSRVSLPKDRALVLTPGVLDSALQSCIGMQLAKSTKEILLPFSVAEIELYQDLTDELWCHIKKNKAGKRISSYDIDLLNNQGQVVLRFKELVLLPVNGFVANDSVNDTEMAPKGLSLLADHWKYQPEPVQSLRDTMPIIILAGGSGTMADDLYNHFSLTVTAINTVKEEDFFMDMLSLAKTVMPHKKATHIVVACSQDQYYQYGFITGLLKTLTQENPRITGKLISIEDQAFQNLEELGGILMNEKQNPDHEVRYSAGKREVRSMENRLIDSSTAPVHIKSDGVYLITGGAGGLGLIFAQYLNKTEGATIILTGRSPQLNPSQQKAVDQLDNALYYPCDISDESAVNDLIQNIIEKHTKLDGVIHSAGVIRDSMILQKTKKEVKEVFAAKIKGTRNLDMATKDLPLEFMITCSSVAGVNGNAGQSDYASANTWMDNYAHYRESERMNGRRYGKTLSINWPLWKEGGMQISAEAEIYMMQHFGLAPMPTDVGIKAFESLMNSGITQGMVLFGDTKEEKVLVEKPEEISYSPTETSVNNDSLYNASIIYLRGLLAKELRMPEEKLKAEVPFEQYGIDSVLVIRLSNCLQDVFGKLPRTLFFEYLTLKELCGYFMEAHRSLLLELTGLAVVKASAPLTKEVIKTERPVDVQNRRQRFSMVQQQSGNKNINEDIAIIGISGRYPDANNLEEFWENLKIGKDCITQVPADRWNADEMYHEEKGRPGKSYSKWGGFMNDIDKFDPLFFSISPREAELMDPQERLFLQTVWETIEDAGYTRDSIRSEDAKTGIAKKIGVYAGVMYEEYQLFGAEERMKGNFVTPAGIASSIANRISYFFNFNGPSMAVDTMCSSSLTAIHLACNDLIVGNTDVAVAGGVNISVHPNKYLMLSQGRFVSGAGRCESFGMGGDGYVPGEGVGAVLLKRVSEAIKDGDHIYGLIKGTALNHGGKTNGYTVPNPKAQAAVIKAAIEKSGVKASDLSYVEAHGTGTSLGDPIEIAGLNRAFETTEKQFCSIGSVKSNIGHCESAAGISGLTKVILQLKHQQLVPSLHSAVLNPDIDFENSPFKVQQQLEEWPTNEGKPRIAGISGFGAGGSNAHIIIEEYAALSARKLDYKMPVIIALSAKHASRIAIQVENLKNFLEKNSQADLYDVAYTLQIGREEMEERLAFIATDKEDLMVQLSDYLDQKTMNPIRGNIRKKDENYIQHTKDLLSIAMAWVNGVDTDWNSLYPKGFPSRISLPAYPFIKDRYWIPIVNDGIVQYGQNNLHPLLHSNDSDLNEQKFISTYTGEEDFLTQCEITNYKELPSSALLELAREAGERSLRQRITQLKNVSWVDPIRVNGVPANVQINLFNAGNEIGYEIYTKHKENKPQLNGQGLLNTEFQQPHDQKNIEDLIQYYQYSLEKEALYSLFAKAGKTYAADFQGVEILYFDKLDALAKIVLPVTDEFILSPGVLDNIVQTSTGWLLSQGEQSLYQPSDAAEITIFGTLPSVIWCHATFEKKQSGTFCCQMDIMDEEGTVLLHFRDLVLSPQVTFQSTSGKASSIAHKPMWDRIITQPEASVLIEGKQILVTGGSDPVFGEELGKWLMNQGAEVTTTETLDAIPDDVAGVYLLQGLTEIGDDALMDDHSARELAVFTSIKQLLDAGIKDLKLTVFTSNTQKVLPDSKITSAGSGMIGMTGALIKEQPQWSVNRIDLDVSALKNPAEINWTDLFTISLDNKENAVTALRNGHYYRQHLYPIVLPEVNSSTFRNGGTYVLLGGAGGLGKATTEYLVKNYQAKIIWLGRRVADEAIMMAQEEIAKLGQKPEYYSCDATDPKQVEKAYKLIKENHSEVHGLFHSAIVLHDMLLKNMTEDDFKKAFMPKSLSSQNLVYIFKNEPLDFICFYSSAQSLVHAPGQANYASGCSFKDSYALNVNHLLNIPVRIINWGYWGEIGIVAADGYKEKMKQAGIESIETEEGMHLLETVLNNNEQQIVALKLSAATAAAMPTMHHEKEISQVRSSSVLQMEEADALIYPKADEQDQIFEMLCCKGILKVLLQLGLEEKQTTGQTISSLRSQLSINDKYEQLFFVLIHLLETKGYVTVKDTQIFVAEETKDALNDFDFEQQMSELVMKGQEYRPHGTLLKICLESFIEIITGKIQATSVMFPGGSMDYVSGIYKGNAQSDYFNDLLTGIIKNSVAASIPYLKPGEKIRILEVGAGTGGTSQFVFRALEPYKDHLFYLYTDLSHSFLHYAEQQFKTMAPYLETAILNIESDPSDQQIELGSYDIVIGANVVHATKNMAVTLNNIKALLKQDGLLIMNEIARTEIFTTLTFGLLDGWWLYEDRGIRLNGSPGLSSESWQNVLKETGYLQAISYPQGEVLSQQIICATSDGKIISEIKQPEKKHEIKMVPPVIQQTTAAPKQKMPVMKKTIDNNSLIQQLTKIAADLIKLPPGDFDIECQFMDYGFDSILSMELIKNINEKLKVDLKSTDIFSYGTIQQLAEHLMQNFSEALQVEVAVETSVQASVREVETPLKTRFTAPVKAQEPVYRHENDIAIIGMSGQFGAANDLDAFWEVLKNGKSLIGDVPADRWQGYTHNEGPKWTGSFLRDIDKFDPVFFKISGNEAEMMDPQQRLFLEHCWKAIEDAAINPKSLKGSKCGVYAGVAPSDYNIRECEEASVMWGNSSAVLAARISYFLDLKGPAISVDTACSSSLLAMDMGCSSLQKGETDLIIAGGINIMTTPGFYSLASRAGMMSSTGQCHTFDKKADGFVPGEGVGVVIMKRLADAERDGDRIYGVIKASLTNQDGASNGITAPSVLAQQELEKEVYKKFNINPETISYVEAHGTGTSLGDPIELDALTNAFRKYTEKTQYCRIGSVKTNIGHTLVAAGVAGVLKIMLSLKHKQLVPTLNFEECNPLIDLVNSPFQVGSELTDWKTENQAPRRAAISSFGFSGTNVHMVIEEYPENKVSSISTEPALIIISAKNAERLKNQVSKLLSWLERNPRTNIQDIAYTLQVGREPMEERFALLAADQADLMLQLDGFLKGNTENLMIGNIKKDKADFLLEGGAGKAYIDYAIAHGEIKSLAVLWTKGITINWDLLYQEQRPNKISLPTYAFARQSYWIPEVKSTVNRQQTSYLHPLIHRNTSTVKSFQFSSTFTGNEEFLSDHKIQNEIILPGVAYLEMARISGTELLSEKITVLKNIAWMSPVRVNGKAEEVHIRLKSINEELSYEIYSLNGQEQLHSQGRISTQSLPVKSSFDLTSIQNRMSESVDRATCYDIFRQMGLQYGNSFMGIEHMYYSSSEALSKITLPKLQGFSVSPGLLDSALQTCMGMGFIDKKPVTQLPFSVKEVVFYEELPLNIWSYARKSKANQGNGAVITYDVDILDDHGKVLMSFHDFVTLPVDGTEKTEWSDAATDACIFTMNWEECAAESFAGHDNEAIPMVLLVDSPAQLAENLKTELGIETTTIDGAVAEDYLIDVMSVIKKRALEKNTSHLLIVCCIADYLDYGFISGLLKTASLENPGITGKIISVERLSVKDAPELTSILQTELGTADAEIRYESGLRKVKKINEINISDNDGLKIKENGVYLIVGGAGGIGRLFATHINKIPKTKVILTGRGQLDEEKEAFIAGLAHGDYFSCDVNNKEEVVSLLDQIKEKYHRIDGIIHSAGVTQDSLIVNKIPDEVEKVFAAKVNGVKNIDEATKDEALDFMVLFSGLAAITGNAGQADYAAANVYLDNYAVYRESERNKGKRQGKTISINWPFWKEGGMVMDETNQEYLDKQYGLSPLPKSVGINIFDQLLGSNYTQGIVTYGKVDKIRSQLLNRLVVKQKQVQAHAMPKSAELQDKVASKLLEITAQLLKLSESDIERDEKLSDYGFDSILLIKYSNELNDFYDTDLTPAVFYNYPTINDLADFLLEEYQEKITAVHQPEALSDSTINDVEEIQEEESPRYPLSEGQKGLWFIQQLEPENTNYNVPVSFIIPGTIDYNVMKKAFQLTLDEYPVLKSRFLTDETGEIYNQIQNVSEVEVDDQELAEGQNINEVSWNLVRKPFNLEIELPVRLYVRRDLAAHNNYILLVFHHIIFDGMSSSVFIASLFEKCQKLLDGEKIVAKEPDFAYFSYVEWEKNFILSKKGEKSLAYWKKNLSGTLPIINLPYDLYKQNSTKTTTIGIERIKLVEEKVDQLKELGKKLKVNLSVLFSGIYAMLLHKLTTEEDLLILMPTAGRPKKEYENSIGYYVNMMILRNRVSGNQTFAELVKNIQKGMINGMSHAAYPLPKLLSDLNLDRFGNRETPFKVSFIYQNIFDEILTGGGSGIEIYDEVYQETAHVYSLEIQDLRKEIIVSLKYDQDVFSPELIQQHMGYFMELMNGVLENTARQIKTYEVLSKEEINYFLYERNDTAVEYPKHKTLSDLFEEQVLKTPDQIAVVHDGRRITYAELNEMANRLAGELVKSGLPANAPVAMVSHKSLEQVWGVLGILKAGGHYIPVKGSLPENRMNELIKQTESTIVLVQPDYMDKVSFSEEVKIILLEERTFAEESADHETVKVPDTELAYIIFTSGSTGKPKGVMIDHRGAVNTLYDMNARFGITSDDKVFGISDLNFDLSVYDIFGTFACGATLILPLETEGLNPDIWLRYVKEEQVTVWNSVPQIVNLLIERQEDTSEMHLSSLRMYWMSGDWIPLDVPGRIKKINPDSAVISLGGATEGSIWSIHYPIGEINPSWKSIPYGYPLGNQEMYVLDINLSPCPVNVPGDIYIGGIGVAKGYHQDPEKTAASFIEHPGMQKQLYRTGDIGCQHPDGFIVFLGRQDGQVKINGFRVELGEVETILQLSPLVKQGLVLTVEDDNRNKRLVAYVVANDVFDKEEMQKHLRAHLPEYMVPSIFIEIDKIPLSSNGKVDRKALPSVDPNDINQSEFTAPSDETEHKLAEIWIRLLKLNRVGIHDDFFDVGGNSLTMIQLAHKINTAFDKDIQLIHIMKNPTIAGIKILINGNEESCEESVLTLREGNMEEVTFVIPGALGSTEGYFTLAGNLPGEGAVYGLQMKGITADEAPNTSIETMASYNLEQIKQTGVIGGINLLAHSYGGIVIYEMIRQAKELAIEIDKVIFLDCFTDPLSSFNSLEEAQKLGTYFRSLIQFSQPWLSDDAVEELVKQLPQEDYMPFICDTVHTLPAKTVARMWEVFRASISAVYKMEEKLDQTLIFVEADNTKLSGEDWGDQGAAAGWDQYFSDVQIIPTEANHFTIVNTPYCTEWLTKINTEENIKQTL